MSLELSMETPSFDFELDFELDFGGDLGLSGLEMPDLDIAPDSLAYEGSLEWTVVDQAAFEGAVTEYSLENPDEYSWSTSPHDQDLVDAQDYFDHSAETNSPPLEETSVFEQLFSQDLAEGVWLSSLDVSGDGEELEPELEKSRLAAIKYLATEEGLGVENVKVEREGQTIYDAIIHSYALAELPQEPYNLGGKFICEGQEITEAEARRVTAARSLAKDSGNSTLTHTLVDMLVKARYYYEEPEYGIQIDIEKTKEDKDQLALTATKYEKSHMPHGPYMQAQRSAKKDTYLARISSLNVPELPYVKHVTENLEHYDVNRYKYTGTSTDGGERFTATLEQ